MFTPQVGDQLAEILSPAERAQAIAEMIQLRQKYPKLDMPRAVIQQFAAPPHSPADCVFALTTQTISADLETKITPCQFGGTPDCAQCGCIASMGLASVAAHKLGGFLPVGAIFKASIKIGKMRAGRRANSSPQRKTPLNASRDTRPAPVLARRSEVPFNNAVLESLPVLQPAQDHCANQETELTR
jgi:hypothetical protein